MVLLSNLFLAVSAFWTKRYLWIRKVNKLSNHNNSSDLEQSSMAWRDPQEVRRGRGQHLEGAPASPGAVASTIFSTSELRMAYLVISARKHTVKLMNQ